MHTCKYCTYTSDRNFCIKRHEINKHSKEILNEMKNTISEEKRVLSEEKEVLLEETGFLCKKCNKLYKIKKFLLEHEKICKGVDSLTCPRCMRSFTNSSNKSKHIKRNTCEPKSIIHDKQQTIETQTFENIEPINNHLVNIILEKDKKINELNDLLSDNKSKIIIEDNKVVPISTLTLNNIVITSRICDNYINATLLCQAGNKRFNDWYRLNTTKELIKELKADTGIPVSGIIDKKELINELKSDAGITASGIVDKKELIKELKSDAGIPVSQIIDMKADAGIPVSGIVDKKELKAVARIRATAFIEINKGGNDKNNQETWIHPNLAIQLAQWISPTFALQVSKWILQLFSNGQVSIDKIIQEKDQRIKLLEDTYLKKHKRMDYDGSNVIYMLTTNYYKNKRIYIIGKAKSLKDRLSTYNKTMDHEVVYYKECDNENDMNIIEKVVLNKLNKYREIANRDHFILPLENDIILFTNVIDACVNFFI